MSVFLRPGEKLVDLDRDGLKLIQNPKGFLFGMDSVLLSSYAKAYKGHRVADLCTGSGVVPILMSSRCKGASFVGVEIAESAYDLAVRNVKMNGLEERIRIVKGDIREDLGLTRGSFHAVTVNPPYLPVSASSAEQHTERDIARMEILCNIADVCGAAEKLLKFGGKLFLVYRADRTADCLAALRNNKLEPKTIRYIHKNITSKAKLFLLSAEKGAAPGVLTEAPLVMQLT